MTVGVLEVGLATATVTATVVVSGRWRLSRGWVGVVGLGFWVGVCVVNGRCGVYAFRQFSF